jgi:hypothetical protein
MDDPDSNTVTAALVVIGEEILSGRSRTSSFAASALAAARALITREGMAAMR